LTKELVPISCIVNIHPKIEITPNSLTVTEELTKEEFIGGYNALERIEGANCWWKGDLAKEHNKHKKDYGDIKELAKENGWNYDSLRVYKSIAEKYEVLNRFNTLGFLHHAVVAPRPDRLEWLERAAENNWSVKELVNEVRKADKLLPPTLPKGIYNVIYADPPWRYDFSETESRSIEAHYESLELDEICYYTDSEGTAIQDKIADNAVLFLWATQPKIREALRVIEAWGFDYKTGAIWVKDKIGMGYYFREKHELILVAKKGELAVPEPENRPPSTIEAPRLQHSRKPECVYEIIERMYPGHKYMECFSRTVRPGWTGWGKEYER